MKEVFNMLGINKNAPDFNVDTVFGEGEDF